MGMWRVEYPIHPDDLKATIVRSDPPYTFDVAEVYDDPRGGHRVLEDHANLIAAAPMLLEALGMIVYQYDKGHFGRPLAEAVERARAIIAKAKGE